jgi:hypothetical protein
MQENMFMFGDKNKTVVESFIRYTQQETHFGMCISLGHGGAIEFLKDQKPFKDCITYPVEYAVLRHKKKRSTFGARDRVYGKYDYANSTKHLYGKLRVWWAYNLAIAASQGKM